MANIAWAYAVVLGDQTSRELALGLFHAATTHQLGIEGHTQLFQLMAVSSPEVQAAVAADPRLRQLKDLCSIVQDLQRYP